MPLERLSAEAVTKRMAGQKARIYPRPDRPDDRLAPYAQPLIKPGFTFGPDASIFATGSCFARNVEKALVKIGANVVSSPSTLPVSRPPEEQQPLYNKYTVHSILQEIRWALSSAPVDHSRFLVSNADGLTYDLNVTNAADTSGSLEEMTAFRSAFNETFSAAASADVVIVTLGLVECWYDRETETYLNVQPPKDVLRYHTGRFEFHVLDHDDILHALYEIHDILTKARSGVAPNMLVTVSPVSFAATFRPQDALVANSYSKAVQRAAAESFVMTREAAYFPSYEYVTLSDNKFAWANRDYRHVRQETVDRIMGDVLKAYVGESQGQRLLETRGHAEARLANKEAADAVSRIEAYFSDYPWDDDLYWLYIRALRSNGQDEACLEACETSLAKNTIYFRSIKRTRLNLLKKMGQTERLKELAQAYAAEFPNEIAFANSFLPPPLRISA